MTRPGLWRAAVTGRVSYAVHRVAGHDVVWRTLPRNPPRCAGDIVCYSCAQVLWCRAFDPWKTQAAHPLGPDDHWGTTSEGTGGVTLFEGLDHVLRLAQRFPAGASGNDVRQAVYDLIEARNAADGRNKLRRLLSTLEALQQRRSRGRSRADDADAAAVDTFVSTLRREVIPALKSRTGWRGSARSASA